MTGEIEDDFCIFPIATEPKYTAHSDFDSFYYFLNDVNINKTAMAHDGKPYYNLAAYDEHLITGDSDILITEPVGYGVTPFLKLNYVLKEIFRYLGYELQPSFFSTNPDYNKMVVLNNTADAILKGTIDYSQLLPDTTIDNFLSSLRKKYLLDFFINDDGKSVEVRLLDNILTEDADDDYSLYIDGDLEVEYEEPKQIKLTSKRSLEKAAVVFDSSSEFFRNNVVVQQITTYDDVLNPELGVIYVKNAGFYFKREYFPERTVDGVHIGAGRFSTFYTRDLFNFYNKYESLKTEEFESSDEFIPMILSYFTTGAKTGEGVASTMRMPIPFIGAPRHLNSYVKTSSGDIEEDKENSCPLGFCFAIGRSKVVQAYKNSTMHFLGTILAYDNAGNRWGESSLLYNGENGLFEKNWKKYDDILRGSNPVLTGKINLPQTKIASLRMDRLKIIHGQPVLPLSIKYEQKNGFTEVKEMQFKCIKGYE
jgi:hypothetical protein